MAWWQYFILIEFFHNAVGIIFTCIFCEDDNCIVFENLNPVYIYNNRRVNWFGAIMLTLFANLLCPLLSISFWFYKLCTIGRR